MKYSELPNAVKRVYAESSVSKVTTNGEGTRLSLRLKASKGLRKRFEVFHVWRYERGRWRLVDHGFFDLMPLALAKRKEARK